MAAGGGQPAAWRRWRSRCRGWWPSGSRGPEFGRHTRRGAGVGEGVGGRMRSPPGSPAPGRPARRWSSPGSPGRCCSPRSRCRRCGWPLPGPASARRCAVGAGAVGRLGPGQGDRPVGPDGDGLRRRRLRFAVGGGRGDLVAVDRRPGRLPPGAVGRDRGQRLRLPDGAAEEQVRPGVGDPVEAGLVREQGVDEARRRWGCRRPRSGRDRCRWRRCRWRCRCSWRWTRRQRCRRCRRRRPLNARFSRIPVCLLPVAST